MSARPGVAQISHKTAKPALSTHWMARRACDASIDFCSEDQTEITLAKQVCTTCPVIQECLAYALARSEATGVYGGMSADDRRGRFRKWKTPSRSELALNSVRVCKDCGAHFIPQHHLSGYCGAACRERSRVAKARAYEARHRQKVRSEKEAAS